MIVEHWIDDESTIVFLKGDLERHRKLFIGNPIKCCEIEGENWEDCMTRYHEHIGWESYKSGSIEKISDPN